MACWTAAGLVLAAGACIRFFRIGDQLVLDDEWHALNVVQDQGYGFIFSHLGHADHSIPLALLFEWFSRTVGLDEWTMRLPSLLAGSLLIVVFPLLMRPWLSRPERVILAALLALSPLLIYYSRIARPYALLALLASACVPLAWRWWKDGRRGPGAAWYFCAVLAGWLNPVSLAVTTAPFLWFGTGAVLRAKTNRDWSGIRRLAWMGLAIGATLAALLFVPLENDYRSLAVKAGQHEVSLATLNVMLSLFSGSGSDVIVALMATASLAGLLVLRCRDESFSGYLAFVALASGFAVAMTGAEWINQGIVVARYLIGLLPVYLALVALALAALAGHLRGYFRWTPAAMHGFTGLVLLLLIASGPARSWDLGRNQFFNHLSLQFDYRESRNPFRQAHEGFVPDGFYAEIAQLHPDGDALIVEAPWYLESTWNPLYLSQNVHGQRVAIGFVGGVCAGPVYGEIRKDAEGLNFRHFIRLEDLLRERTAADYLVLRRGQVSGARGIEMDFEACEKAAVDALGEPWRESETALVFRLDSGS